MTALKHSKTHVYALHGFLGSPNDWNMFDFVNHPVTIDREDLNLWDWSRAFKARVKTNQANNVLLGYSLGGRLAMHVLLSDPSLWSSAIFVSAHPGLESAEEKVQRRAYDKLWADRFLSEPWDALLQEWNKLPVFAGKTLPGKKEEKNYNRAKLAQQLNHWSLGKQDFLIGQLSHLSIPILFIAGGLDHKYCALAESFCDFADVSIIANAGHRVPWDQPALFKKEVDKFLNRLELYVT